MSEYHLPRTNYVSYGNKNYSTELDATKTR